MNGIYYYSYWLKGRRLTLLFKNNVSGKCTPSTVWEESYCGLLSPTRSLKLTTVRQWGITRLSKASSPFCLSLPSFPPILVTKNRKRRACKGGYVSDVFNPRCRMECAWELHTPLDLSAIAYFVCIQVPALYRKYRSSPSSKFCYINSTQVVKLIAFLITREWF